MITALHRMRADWTGRFANGQHAGAEHRRHRRAAVQLTQQGGDVEQIPAEPGTEPEQIAGSLAEFAAALRDNSVPSGEVHGNVMSLAKVEGAIQSARTGQPVVLGDLLDAAYRQALAAEQHPSWLQRWRPGRRCAR